MKISYKWLNSLVDLDGFGISEIADILVSRGIEVEAIEETKEIDTRVVVAEITDLRQHENADKLSVLKVNDGEAEYQVICGAKNMKRGDKVALAKQSAKLPNGIKIKKSKLRGVLSEGMCCSLEELGMADHSEGIYIVDTDKDLGTPVKELFTKDTILDLAISPNRGDELSHLGIARELSYALNRELKFNLDAYKTKTLSNSDFKVKVESASCPRYYAMEFKNIKLTESPKWLQDYLNTVGLRPINNIVDITNYVLLGLGQPLHVFDADKIDSKLVLVKDSEEDFLYTALDEKTYQIKTGDLLITNSGEPLAIAGIIGGKDSEVSNDTKNILLECAIFEPTQIRKTARRLGLQTDSSYRFERGISFANVEKVFWHTVSLIEELAKPEELRLVAPYISKARYPHLESKKDIEISVADFNDFIGIQLNESTILNLLKNNGYEYVKQNNKLYVVPPSYRLDVELGADVYEDLAKYYGYDNITAYLPESFELNNAVPSKTFVFKTKLRDILSGYGLSEVVSYSFVSKKNNELFGAKAPITLLNPIAEDFTEMRQSLLSSILPLVYKNINNGNKSLALFEISKVFFKHDKLSLEKPDPADTVYNEITKLCILLNETENPDQHWMKNNIEFDYFYLKGILENLFKKLSFSYYFVPLNIVPSYVNKYRASEVFVEGRSVGILAEFMPQIQTAFKLSRNAVFTELDLDTISNLFHTKEQRYEKYSQYPSVRRDISMLVDEGLYHKDIETLMFDAGTKYLKKINLYDLYTGKNIPKGKKAMAYSLIFNSTERTLTDKDIDKDFKKVVNVLQRHDKISMK